MRLRGLAVATVGCFVGCAPADQGRGTVLGEVRRQGDAAPISGAGVEIPAYHAATTTDRAGRFALPDVPAGRVAVVVRRAGFAPESLGVAVLAGAVVHRRVALVPAADVRLGPMRIIAERSMVGLPPSMR